MSNFVPRKSAPSTSDKHYYSDNVFYKSGYGMPNCTCYAWGRFYELLGSKPKLYTGNAKTWFPKGKAYDGYDRGQTPKLGAICCWSNSRAGHVSVVEEIYSDGSILTSNSAWKSTNFYTKKIAKGYAVSGYTFQGFIYLPISFSNNSTSNFSVGKTYTTNVNLKVRVGAGTDQSQKNKSELTVNGQANALNQTLAVLKSGTKVTVLELKEIGADVWARIPSGWIALKYNGKIYVS